MTPEEEANVREFDLALGRSLRALADEKHAAEQEALYSQCWAQMDAILDRPSTPIPCKTGRCACWQPVEDDQGFQSCERCGQQPHQIVTQVSYSDMQRTYTERRISYMPLIYFKEHLRRYLGCQRKIVPPALFRFFARWKPCRHIYFRIARALSYYRVYKAYKWIYPIIYQVFRVPKPQLTNAQFHAILNDYRGLQHYFCLHRCGRRSMPSHFVCLDYLLHRHGHRPTFVLPRLKTPERQQRLYSQIAVLQQYKYPAPAAAVAE